MFYPDDPDYDEFDDLPPIKNMPLQRGNQLKQYHPNHKPKRSPQEVDTGLADQFDDQRNFDFTYQASRHERAWITDSLGTFFEMQWFSDLLRLIKGGKEASVYQCAIGPASPSQRRYLAAKIYRPRRFRQLKNDHLYREGRPDLDADGNMVIDHGMLHAMQKRSEYGRQLSHASWIEHEYQTLRLMHAAGADVPVPYTRGENAILMEYIGGEDFPAPTLNTIDLAPGEALPLFERVLHNVELMLAHGRVHADLSAYNILYWQGEITLIDFPQSISPGENRNAYHIFERDLIRVCEYFARQGVAAEPRRLAARLWTAHKYRLKPEVHPSLLDAEDERDRRLWQSQQEE
jgi:RIO kinase 1